MQNKPRVRVVPPEELSADLGLQAEQYIECPICRQKGTHKMDCPNRNRKDRGRPYPPGE